MANTDSATHSAVDVVVVGSGVAGSLVAAELAAAGLRVHILEAGGHLERARLIDRYRSSWQRDLNAPFPRYAHAPVPDLSSREPYLLSDGPDKYWAGYVRGVGGSTWHWTGITPRFVPSDFELRTRYGVGDDWPLSYADLEPYYVRAERELGVAGDSEDDHGSPRSAPYPMLPLPMSYCDRVIARRLAVHGIQVKVWPAARNSSSYDGRPACCGSNSCSPICPTGAQYSADVHVRKARRAGAKLTTHAVAHRLEAGPDGRITAVHYKDPGGGSHRLAGRCFVLACNGIETPRLLLMSRSERTPAGVANHTDQVGRHLMGHPSFGTHFLMPEPIYAGRGPQVICGLDYGRDGSFRRHYAAAKWFVSNAIDLHAYSARVIERELDWAGIESKLIRYATHAGYIGIELETLPDPANRVRIADHERDRLGLPKPLTHYRLDEYVRQGAAQAERMVRRIVEWLGASEQELSQLGDFETSHVMGTTRMGDDPARSVVDRHCCAHDHPNLFIAGSGVFTTSGTANPTLTLSALALRLAGTLRDRLGRGEL